jgi:hypothetical protein
MKSPQSFLALATIAAAGLVAACGSTPVSLDNPKDGASVQLAVQQPLTVRLSNVTGGGRWVREGEAPDALQALDAKVRDAANGAMQLETFEFVAAAPGDDVLTFVYRRPGAELTADDVIRIKVDVG